MKISIGLRLFASVLLAILTVAAGAVFLLRQNVLESFGDYAVQIELDRLEELSTELARRHARHGNWDFIPADGRREWIARELARLQLDREARALPAAPAPAAPVLPARAVAPALPAIPAPPAPPAPPLPPLPPPSIRSAPAPDDDAPLQARITLFDAAGTPIAGKPPGTLPLARRAILVEGRPVGSLAVARTARPTDALAYAFLQQLGATLWLIAAAGVALSALAAVLLAAHFRRPIARLAQGARALRTAASRPACLTNAATNWASWRAISTCWRRVWKAPKMRAASGSPTPRTNCARRWPCCAPSSRRCRMACAAPTRRTSRRCCARCWRCRGRSTTCMRWRGPTSTPSSAV